MIQNKLFSFRGFPILFIWIVFTLSSCTKTQPVTLKLWYTHPATNWMTSALPIGNGELGAMFFGGVAHEQIQFNEKTLWTGSTTERGAYQSFGDLYIDFKNQDSIATEYRRELSLDDAIGTVSYQQNGVQYLREYFVSYPDKAIVMRLSTPGSKGKLNFTVSLSEARPGTHLEVDKSSIFLHGNLDLLSYEAQLKVLNEGGTLISDSDKLSIKEADAVTLLLVAATNFDLCSDTYVTETAEQLHNRLTNSLQQATTKNYEELKAAHLNDYRPLFNRVQLDLNAKLPTIPTDELVRSHKESLYLDMLYFQYGRYLMLSSSRGMNLPNNLQGIWNYQLRAPWDGKYTTDINVEMNYWPAETTALSEMHEPFLQLVKEVAIQGRESASMYGCRGWTLHHNTDIWRTTGAVDGAKYGVWPTCNAWFCQHLWDRYLFSGDKNYLAEVYPIMRGACEFYLDFLVREPKNNWLVVAPSYSPENSPSVNGKRGFVIVAGTTMDNQMVYDLFYNTIQAANLMNENTAFTDSLQTVANHLAPMQVGRWGQLQEWMEDWDNPQDHHRHVSHLWGLYPGRQISAYHSPVLFEAAKTSLTARGDHSTGWSMGWKVCLWARLLDGNHAYKLITEQLHPTTDERGQNGGTYPNLFDAHPPFQIDGNFGCTAGITEMFVQSHDGAVHLLPALPDVWERGVIKGIRCRGGFLLEEMKWEKGQMQTATICSTIGGTLRIRTGSPLYLNGEKLSPTSEKLCKNPFLQPQAIRKPLIVANSSLSTFEHTITYVYDIETKPGKKYILSSKAL